MIRQHDATQPAPPLLETQDLSLLLDGRALIASLQLRVNLGERWCVIGRNATGKSSLLRALAGLPPARGELGARRMQVRGDVRWHGRRPEEWHPADAATVRAFMPQHSADRFPISTARLLELSAVGSSTRGAAAMLDGLDIRELAQREVMSLSGGERQRVALAQCAMQGTPLLLLDEPVAFQDPAHQVVVSRWIAGLRDAAFVISAHDVNWVARTATHVLALAGDGSTFQGPVRDVLTAERLQAVFRCEWRRAGDAWIVSDSR